MPFFTPPTQPDLPLSSPDRPAYRLFRFFGERHSGLTVWKDQDNIWHETLYPYWGGEITRTYDGTHFDQTGPTPGLATALVYYLGGHDYTITDNEAIELVAAGYGAYVTDAPPNPDPEDPDPDAWPPDDLTYWVGGDGVAPDPSDYLVGGDGVVPDPTIIFDPEE